MKKRGEVFATTKKAKENLKAYNEKKDKQCKGGCGCAPKAQEKPTGGFSN